MKTEQDVEAFREEFPDANLMITARVDRLIVNVSDSVNYVDDEVLEFFDEYDVAGIDFPNKKVYLEL